MFRCGIITFDRTWPIIFCTCNRMVSSVINDKIDEW